MQPTVVAYPPQAVRKVTPPLLNDFVAMQKDVGLISILGAVDAVRAAQMARIGLEAKAHDFPDRLSGGQQQRAALVRALVSGPRLLLLDEVTSALALSSSARFSTSFAT